VEHGLLVVSQGEGPPAELERELPVPGSVEFEAAGLTIEAEIVTRSQLDVDPGEAPRDLALFDWDAVQPPVSIRSRREGDRIRPFGMDGSQSVKDLFINSKIAFSFRSSVPLVCDRSGVLWVAGVRRSADAPITDTTERVLAIRARTREVQPGTREDTAL
jgi:tRNA(Ile)-lysidine synthase